MIKDCSTCKYDAYQCTHKTPEKCDDFSLWESEAYRNIESLLAAGNEAEKEKLEKYYYKPDWKDYDLELLTVLKRAEDQELETEIALFNHGEFVSKEQIRQNIRDIRLEAADVRAYTAMIIEWCNNQLKDGVK